MKAYERFLKYISFDTQSDENSDTCPSTEGQLVLGDFLANELRELGAVNVEKDENGYVYMELFLHQMEQRISLSLHL